MKTDIDLQKDVMEELQWDPLLLSTEVGIAVKDGIVTLMGHVNNYGQKLAAENAAKRVKDVKAVAVDIDIKLPLGHERTDADIAAAALNALKWSSFVPEECIKLTVENGRITLEGEVEWQFQKKSATSALKNLIGLQGINNHLKVKPQITPIIVKDVIRKALERRADIEADRIDIITDGGRITLKGNVRSWTEKTAVEQAVWSTPGVIEVKDELRVSLL